MEAGLQNKLRIGAIVQARMQSSRLPGKILMPLPLGDSGKPLLKWITDSAASSKLLTSLTIATSENTENDVLEKFCEKEGLKIFRGSENDVLSRFQSVIKKEDLDVVVRLTADNPFLDVGIMDMVIDHHIRRGADYTKTENLPLGMNIEVANARALLEKDSTELKEDEREHVTLYLRRTSKSQEVYKPVPENYAHLRLTIDHPADFVLAGQVALLFKNRSAVNFSGIKKIYEEYPWLFSVNQSIFQKKQFSSFEEEKKEALDILQKLEMFRISQILES